MDGNNNTSTGGNSSAIVAASRLTAEAAAEFQEGIKLVLSRWRALQWAVEEQFAGTHSRFIFQKMGLDVFSLFTCAKEKAYIEDVEEFLDTSMEELNLEPDDGSMEEVALVLMLMHEECLEGNFSSIQKLRATNPPPGAITHVVQATNDSDSEDIEDGDSGNLTNLAHQKWMLMFHSPILWKK